MLPKESYTAPFTIHRLWSRKRHAHKKHIEKLSLVPYCSSISLSCGILLNKYERKANKGIPRMLNSLHCKRPNKGSCSIYFSLEKGLGLAYTFFKFLNVLLLSSFYVSRKIFSRLLKAKKLLEFNKTGAPKFRRKVLALSIFA